MAELRYDPSGSRPARQSLSDAVEALHNNAARRFTGAHASVEMMRLPDSTEAAVVLLVDEVASDGLAPVYTVPFFCPSFRARETTQSTVCSYQIELLDGATIFPDYTVALSGGRYLAAVEFCAAKLKEQPSYLEWLIVQRTIEYIGAQDSSYRSLRHGLPSEMQPYVPDLRLLDCSKLRGHSIPGLKQIQGFLADRGSTVPSQQTIANALRAFGMRIPDRRPRRRHNSA